MVRSENNVDFSCFDLNLFIHIFQRRSLAPSQLKINNTQSVPSKINTVASLSDFSKPFKSPLINTPPPKRKCRTKEVNENRTIAPTRPIFTISAYEELVARVLSKPFKVPIPDYVPDSNSNRCLGLRRSVIRRALHDPCACNALVLYTPPELNEHDRLTIDKTKILVHVVVDPVVGNILRPHQREGVQFMYQCVTGAKGDFNGCIMADEV